MNSLRCNSVNTDQAGLVFDIGANLGDKTQQFLDEGAGCVVIVEPQPLLLEKLQQRFAGNPRVRIVGKALAAEHQVLNISICSQAPTISTCSEEWKSGRFSNYTWDQQVLVEATTLDALIKEFGVPDYCKVDVEGFELQVLSGLTRQIPLLSFEFTREFIANARKCTDHLDALGGFEYNYVIGEEKNFCLSHWGSSDELFTCLRDHDDQLLWGDIYARHTKSDSLANHGADSEPPPVRLHLGCGERYLEGYINIDYPPSEHSVQARSVADIHADLTQLHYAACSVAEVRLHHVFEHFRRPVALALLASWHYWLVPAGRLRIEVPDFERSAGAMIGKESTFHAMAVAQRHLFGSHEAHWAAHYEGYTTLTLATIVQTMGFTIEKIEQTEWLETFNFELYARKTGKEQTVEQYCATADSILRAFLVDESASEMRLHEVWMSAFREQLLKGCGR